MKTSKDIEWYIYVPLEWQKAVVLSHCRFPVPCAGASWIVEQCSRHRKAEIEGYGFCNQHSERIQAGLRLAKMESSRT